jgi:exodeoxyribonuclease III
LKIATFNINNINKRLHDLTAWLAREQPDVVCLQELKVEQRVFPAGTLRDLGYGGVWLSERSWNGVAILTRDCDPVLTRSNLPGNPDDRQARYVEAAVNGVLIASIYVPNGNAQPGPKFDYKLAWFQRLIDHGAELMKAGVPVILAGDYNVVPAAQDIYPTRSLDKNALIQPQSRQAYARLLSQGWTDALRKLQPEGPLWTFWDYERNQEVGDFSVPRNCFSVTGLWIFPESMLFALAAYYATIATKVPEKPFTLHPTITGCCLASGGSARRVSSRLCSRISAIASRKFARHSSCVFPCPFAPGTSAQYATNQGPSRSTIAVNSLRMTVFYLNAGCGFGDIEATFDFRSGVRAAALRSNGVPDSCFTPGSDTTPACAEAPLRG